MASIMELKEYRDVEAIIAQMGEIELESRDVDGNFDKMTARMKQMKAQLAVEVKFLPKPLQKEVQQKVAVILSSFKANSRAAEVTAIDTVVSFNLNKPLSPATRGEGNMPDIERMMVNGNQVQDETVSAVNRMEGLVMDAQDIGEITAAKMEAQIEKMEGNIAKIDEMDRTLASGRKKARKLAGGIFKDRCILMMLGVILVLLSACIGLVFVGKRQNQDNAA